MAKQEPEEQRLEDQPTTPAEEDVVETSDVPVLNDSDTTKTETEQASETSSEENLETDPEEDQQAAQAEDEPVPNSSDDPEQEIEPASESSIAEAAEADSVEDQSAAVAEAEVKASGDADESESAAPEQEIEPAPESTTSEAAEADSVEEQPAPVAEADVDASDEPVESEGDAPEPEVEPAPLSSSEEMAETESAGDEPAPELDPEDDPSDWFVVHCYSGYENKVRHNLEQRIETMGMKDMIFDVVVPTQEEVEVRDGKRRTVERHIFPGYVLVNMILTEESWYVVRNTPGVTGFVGMGNTPTPLRPDEVSQIVKRMEADAPMIKVTFKVGERVRIIDGPFNDFRGVVAEIDMERTKVRVMVSFFGRETPVELDFLQVEKA